MSDLMFVELRGGSFAIVNPTDVHIRAVQDFAQTPVSDRRRQKELAHALQSMIPSLPHHLASCIEYELSDGTSRIDTQFNLQAYELLAIVQVSAVSYCQRMIEDLKAVKTEDKAESAKIHNQIAALERSLATDLSSQKNPILQVLSGEEIAPVLPDLTEGAEKSAEPEVDAGSSKPRPKAIGMSKSNNKAIPAAVV